jgi:hypothetical protein
VQLPLGKYTRVLGYSARNGLKAIELKEHNSRSSGSPSKDTHNCLKGTGETYNSRPLQVEVTERHKIATGVMREIIVTKGDLT